MSNDLHLKPLKGRSIGPDGQTFLWGPIVTVHTVGRYQIVEYLRDNSNTLASDKQSLVETHGKAHFHPYIDGKDTSMSFETLDRALVGAIARNAEGPNSRAPGYIYRSRYAGHLKTT